MLRIFKRKLSNWEWMWPAESIMQSMRPAMLCRFPTPGVTELSKKYLYLFTNFLLLLLFE